MHGVYLLVPKYAQGDLYAGYPALHLIQASKTSRTGMMDKEKVVWKVVVGV